MISCDLSTGEVRKDGIFIGTFYSGFPPHVNDVDAIHVKDLGPIPVGWWTIEGPPFDSKEHGPYCLRLTPDRDTVTYGRSGFLWHGDSIADPGKASKGCVISNRIVRTRVYQSGDERLYVFASKNATASDVDGEIAT